MNITESVEKLLSQEAVVVCSFYHIFFRNHPEVQQHFDGVDIEQQALTLTNALNVVELHHRRQFPALKNYLKSLGRKHHEMSVLPSEYSKFRSSLLQMLGEFHGQDWDETLAAEWSVAIDEAIELMLEAYQVDVFPTEA
ncbi:MAG: globin domain-containing protein [Planctomycetota bacterium]|nr:globin domain-containing protein [Planctomycetota bacterium]